MRQSSREPSGNGAPLFQPRPEPLDHGAVGVDPLRTGDGCLIARGRNGGTCAALPDVLPEGIAGVAPISHHPLRQSGKRSRRRMA
jgi:hypothetical protein